jgi:ArsR family transcriptional regulator
MVRAGDEGLNVGQFGQQLDRQASTLAHHLKTLIDDGLAIQDRQRRQIVNRVNYEAMHVTISFLTAECCVGSNS